MGRPRCARSAIEQTKLDQLKAQESIIVAEKEALTAKTNAIVFAVRLSEKQDKKLSSSIIPLSVEEKLLIGDWNYLGTLNPISGEEDYNGSGGIFSISSDRTFINEGVSGNWSVSYDNDENKNFLINNSFPMPYTIDSTKLIMSVNVNGTQFIRIYESY